MMNTNTPLPSDIRILDSLLALNLDISLWSARKKLTLEDFGNVPLPPEDLATLGSKRIAPPENLRIFGALKARAFNFLDRHGVRFLSGWAIPKNKAADIIKELCAIRDEFNAQKEAFLQEYDELIQLWIQKHAAWGNIIAGSTVSPEYVRARMGFKWQMYKVAPLVEHQEEDAVPHAGLNEEVENLGNTLFGEVSRTADDIWNRVYSGRTEVTHKALSPLRTLHNKLMGLSFVEPHVTPVADIIHMALNRVPKKGNISGNDLLTLQGLVCLLRDTPALMAHARKVINGYGPATVLDALLADAQNLPASAAWDSVCETEEENTDDAASDDAPDFAPIPAMPAPVHIPSLGLW